MSHPRVIAIVVAPPGARRGDGIAGALDREDPTVAAVTAQTRRVDDVRPVQAATLGDGAARVLAQLPPDTGGDWLWLLPAGAVPEPDALARMLGAVERFPSVAVTGPKLVDPADRSLIRSFGESVSRTGATVRLVEDELDQAQVDADDDVLGVALPGMLVRRAVWQEIGGADPGLPSADAGLDVSVRARLAGHRVVRVAGARVALPARPEDLGRASPLGEAALFRVRRAAQLHRRLAWAPAAAVPFHWLALLPLAVVRAVAALAGKRPELIPAEFGAALGAAFDPSVPGARRRIRRSRRIPWAALRPLRVPGDVVRARRSTERDRRAALRQGPELVRAGFLPSGLLTVAGGAVLGFAGSARLLWADAAGGGALLPLAGDPGTLWSRLAWGLRDGVGTEGPADPFAAVLAVLGTLTPWNPSWGIVLLWIAAPALAALGAWWAATRLSTRVAPPVVAGVLWAVAPPLWSALADGRPGGVVAHLLLPWLAFAGIEATRTWTAAAAASLLMAGTVAAAPSLAPALFAAVVAGAVARPRAVARMLAIGIPSAALFLPLAAVQFARGTPLGVFADPGPAVPAGPFSGWHALVGHPTAATGWDAAAAAAGLPAATGAIVLVVLTAPVVLLALLALFLPGAARAVPAAVVVVAGLATAILSAHVVVAAAGADPVGPWPGAGLSLYWLGLSGAVVSALEALGRAVPGAASVLPGALVAVVAAIAASPLVVAAASGATAVQSVSPRVLPALVVAESAGDPWLGTLVLTPQADGSLGAAIERGDGRTLDEWSTIATTGMAPAPAQQLAALAGNLTSRSGDDPAPALAASGIGFVLLEPAADGATGATAVRQRAAEALDGDPALRPVGETAYGVLWRVDGYEPADAPDARPGPAVAVAQGVQLAVIAMALLLAVPTGRRRPVRRVGAPVAETPDDPDEFAEDPRG